MTLNRRRQLETALGLVSLLAMVGTAYAQDGAAGAETTTLDEIIVTAQKRKESLQSVPFSIQALGEEKLERLNAKDFVDVARQLPSVSFRHVAPGVGNIFMRGISSGPDGGASGSLPSVGVYLDEQPVTTIQGTLDIHMYDIARVEALAGPQGTLYGASSQSGTLRIITNKPEPGVLSGRIDVNGNVISHGGLGYSFGAVLNVPLAESITLRTVAWRRHDAGYIDNVPASRFYPTSGVTRTNAAVAGDNFNDIDVSGARAALRIDLDEDWTVTTSLMGQQTNSHGVPYQVAADGDLNVSRFFDDRRKDRYWQAALTIEGKIADFDITYAGAYLDRKLESHFDYSDYSYYYDQLYGLGSTWVDDGGVPIDPSQYTHARTGFKKTSHELRVSSPADKPLRVTLGGFYQFQQDSLHNEYQIAGLGEAVSVRNFPGVVWLTDQRRRDRDLALFGEVTYDLLPNLSITGGGRLFKSKQSLVGWFGIRAYEALCVGPTQVGTGPCTNVDADAKNDGAIGKLNVTWKIDADRMIYATYSRGFRSGGINRDPRVEPYQPDYLDNYEFGWKTSWDGGRFRFNGALFNSNWDGFQIAVQGANGSGQIRNVGRGRVRGLEFDLGAALAGGLSISAAGSILDPKLRENYCGRIDADGDPITDCATPIAAAGTRLPFSSRYKGTLSVRYDWTMGDSDLFVEAAGAYQASMWPSLRARDRLVVGRIPGFTTVDLSTGVSRGDWRASFYVRNLFDARGEMTRLTSCTPSVCSKVYEVPVQPRNFGIKLGWSF
jgi:outer membrane receptor protein involved in Fe transport